MIKVDYVINFQFVWENKNERDEAKKHESGNGSIAHQNRKVHSLTMLSKVGNKTNFANVYLHFKIINYAFL